MSTQLNRAFYFLVLLEVAIWVLQSAPRICCPASPRSMASRRENGFFPSGRSTCRCALAPTNFQRETLTFEVVGFKGSYHAILGRPCYTKFMAIPNYTYLKLKMSGPKGVITVGPTFEHAYECDVEGVEYAEALAQDKALAADLEKMANKTVEAKFRQVAAFEPADGTKEVPLDPSIDDGKMLKVSSTLDNK